MIRHSAAKIAVVLVALVASGVGWGLIREGETARADTPGADSSIGGQPSDSAETNPQPPPHASAIQQRLERWTNSQGPAQARQTIDLVGQLEPSEQVSVYAKVAGYVKKVHVGLGDRVKKGQVLVELSVPEMEIELKRKHAGIALAQVDVERAKSAVQAAEAALLAVEAQVAQAEADLQGARANQEHRKAEIERLQQLRAGGAIGAELLDEARSQGKAAEAALSAAQAKRQVAQATVKQGQAQVAQSRAEVMAAQSRIVAAEADLQHAEALLDYAQIRAPFDGLVSRSSVAPGTFAAAAAPGRAEPLLVLVQTDPLRVVVEVPESTAPAVTQGMPAVIRIRALKPAVKGQEFRAQVTRVAGVLDPRTRTLRAELELANPEGKLRAGMQATVALLTIDPSGADVGAEKDRLDAARRTYELTMASIRDSQTKVDPERLYQWSRRWLDAQVSLATTDADRNAALAAHRDRMKDLSKLTAALIKSGLAPAADEAAAEYFELEAELLLAQGQRSSGQ